MAVSFTTSRLTVTELTAGSSELSVTSLIAEIPTILTPAVVENLPPYFHGVTSIELAEAWLNTMLSESRLFVVQSKECKYIGFLFAYEDEDDCAHIGYLLAESYWGKGLASELLQGFMNDVLPKEGWRKLIGGVDKTNLASAQLLKKMGFLEQSNSNGMVFYVYVID
ncbi:GNAT family N-acetyltransferase [Vibrio sp. D404a]|uniref:GNAT family N-acetyltransferase n=1 Tax=unclassified Vibrio TaxID=2614977 RepID=UPI002555D9CF|nr:MULTISPECIES: GNAT family N-acetyltransferase [unclassified Vibrio]MDK9738258.1 GNAT family N-acetyltransferase [Vibrio sp. D404a]MDK9796549.1 GNAT family N-acetyltransferase [Vibrio sp. D449a]